MGSWCEMNQVRIPTTQLVWLDYGVYDYGMVDKITSLSNLLTVKREGCTNPFLLNSFIDSIYSFHLLSSQKILKYFLTLAN